MHRRACAACGVHLAARSPKAPGGVIIKAGTLDDPARFGGHSMAVWTEEKQDFHVLPQGVTAFARRDEGAICRQARFKTGKDAGRRRNIGVWKS
jgi:hypothetical protein